MSKIVKNKLCWNCEGNVSRDAINCKYCGVYLHRDDDDEDDIYEEEEVEEEVKPALAIPALAAVSTGPTLVKPVSSTAPIPRPPYIPEGSGISHENAAVLNENTYIVAVRSVIAPLVLLSAGSIFVIFAFLLYFFSTNGVLQLKWSSDYWIYYLLASIPLLFFGWKFLSEQKDTK